MLTLSGFGAVSDEFVECLAEHPDDIEMCRLMHPETDSSGDVIEMPDDYVGKLTAEERQVAASHACDACDPNTQWCDGVQCVPFTAEEQAEWRSAGKPPEQLVVKARPATSLIPGISNRMLMILAAVGLVGVLAFRRTKRA